MGESIRVVAHFVDGLVLKGTTQDFLPNRPSFHLIPADGGPTIDVRCNQMKALFFVKSLQGEPQHTSLRGFLDSPAATKQGRKVAVRFKDGELLCGHTLSYQPGRDGFFLSPADEGSNNLRVYVVVASTAEIKAGPAADTLATKALDAVK